MSKKKETITNMLIGAMVAFSAHLAILSIIQNDTLEAVMWTISSAAFFFACTLSLVIAHVEDKEADHQ
jgi:hypothetical protein